MSVSKEEEMIGTLWIVAAVLAFGFGYYWWGWAFSLKGGTDQVISIFCALCNRFIGQKGENNA